MSPINFILGLSRVVIERVECKKSIHAWAKPSRKG